MQLGRMFTPFTKESRFTVTPLAPASPLPQDYDSRPLASTSRQRNTLKLERQTQHDQPPPPQPRYDQLRGRPPLSETAEPTIPPPPIEKSVAGTSKMSKLSKLADSRSNIAKSFQTSSSRSFAADSASILTYPILRPSPASILSLSSDFTPSKAFTSVRPHIRRTVDASIEQERSDKLQAKSEGEHESPSGRLKYDGQSTATETLRPVSQKQGSRGPSKLALLAQSKAKQNPETVIPWVRPPPAPTRRSQAREAQEHNFRAKFVTPIGNRHTTTTGITTSYQSLGDLMSRGISGLPPSFPPPTDESRSTPLPVSGTSTKLSPLVSKPTPSSTPSDPSKLAMRVKQTQLQSGIPEVDVVEDMRNPPKPMLLSTGGPNAELPPFASVLLEEGESGKKSRREKVSVRKSRRDNGEVDVLSPDDVIFNARKGTSLAHKAGIRVKSTSTRTVTGILADSQGQIVRSNRQGPSLQQKTMAQSTNNMATTLIMQTPPSVIPPSGNISERISSPGVSTTQAVNMNDLTGPTSAVPKDRERWVH